MSTFVTDIASLDPLSQPRMEAKSLSSLNPFAIERRVGFAKLKIFLFTSLLIGIFCFYGLPTNKAVVITGILFGVGSVLLVPLEYGLFVYFVYLLFDGVFKLLSGYHFFAHVGQDIVLMALLWRSLVHAKTGGASKIQNTPFIGFFVIYFVWIFLQYVNPFNLGFLPSLAGSKVYLAPLAIYFLAFHHMDSKIRRQMVIWIVGLATFEGVLATVEYFFFPEVIYSLGTDTGGWMNYGNISEGIFVGALYRPLGTTSLPGQPSVWIYLAAPFATYFLLKSKEAVWVRLLSVIFFIFAIPTLIFCQVRVSIVLGALSLIAVSLYPKGNIIRRLGVASLALMMGFLIFSMTINEVVSSLGLQGTSEGVGSALISTEKLSVLQKRMETLASAKTYKEARKLSFEWAMSFYNKMPHGIGFSRVSAASSPWLDRINKDPYFQIGTFADNMFLTLFIELGIIGMFVWLLVIAVNLFYIFKKSMNTKDEDSGLLMWCCFGSTLVLISGGLDTEGILYAPVSSIFWLMLGMGVGEGYYGNRA